MTTLKCAGCGQHKTTDNFYKRSARPRGFTSRCKSCVGNSSKQVREWRQKNPGKNRALRERERVTVYKLPIEEYHAMLEEQGHKCAICGTDTPGGKGSWHIDHNHETGKVRGLLCAMCNVGLGNFYDRVDLLEGAIAYLKEKDGLHD